MTPAPTVSSEPFSVTAFWLDVTASVESAEADRVVKLMTGVEIAAPRSFLTST